jgi:hypothetical protein
MHQESNVKGCRTYFKKIAIIIKVAPKNISAVNQSTLTNLDRKIRQA